MAPMAKASWLWRANACPEKSAWKSSTPGNQVRASSRLASTSALRQDRAVTFAITGVLRLPTQGPSAGVAAALAASTAHRCLLCPVADPELLAQPGHHFMQRCWLIVDADITIFQRHALGIGLQQKREQTGGIVDMDAIAVERRLGGRPPAPWRPVSRPRRAGKPLPSASCSASRMMRPE